MPEAVADEDEAPRISLDEIGVPTATVVSAVPALRTGRVVSVAPGGRRCKVEWRRGAEPIEADVAPEVEREVLERACEDHGRVLVEVDAEGGALVVGAITTHVARDIHLKAETVTIEAEREILLKTGRAGLRLREDGDVEIVGSRISAASRGLFRLVGRILRLN